MQAPKTATYSHLGAEELALAIAGILDSRQAKDVVILDVSGPLVIADYFVIATARNLRHAQGMAQELDFTMKRGGRLRRSAAGIEGTSPWALLDFDEVIVHIFLPEARSFYALESLWADVPQLPFEPAEAPPDTDRPSTSPATPHVVQPRRTGPDEVHPKPTP